MLDAVFNPAKECNWIIESGGFVVDRSVKSVTLPDIEFTEAEQTDSKGNIDSTPSRYKTGDITIESLVPADQPENYWEEWFESQKNTPPTAHRKTITFHQLGSDKQTIIATYFAEGAWVKKITPPKFDRNSDNDMTKTVVIRCRNLRKKGVASAFGVLSSFGVLGKIGGNLLGI